MIPSRLDTNVVGQNIPKPDATAKVTGDAKYIADMQAEGLLFAVAVRSPYAYAKISGPISKDKAEKVPGVVRIITARDVPGVNKIGQSGWKDQPVLAETVVRFFGEAVAVVAAETRRAAIEAARLLEINYEALDGIYDPEKSLNPDSPQLHEKANLCSKKTIRRGNIEAAFAAADVVVERTYRTPYVEHAYIEPDAAMATWDGDSLTVWTSTKSVHHDQEEICRVLGLSQAKVRVVAGTIGGSFGGKSDIPIVCMVSLLSYLTGRPVKMVYDREECMQVTTKRHPYIIHYRTAATRDGRLTAIEMKVLADAGAYTAYSPSVVARAVIHGAGPYVVNNVFLEGISVFTNNPVSGAMRGYGTPQVFFALEQQMDLVAEELGIDPWDFRAKNLYRPGDKTPTGQILGQGVGAIEALERTRVLAKDMSIDGEKGKYPWLKIGWGFANSYYGNGRTGQLNPGTAILKLEADGRFHLLVGSPDIGQGSDTILGQIAAEALGVSNNQVRVTSADTSVTLDSGTTSGTRLTYVVGNGVLDAGRKLRSLIGEVASSFLETTAGGVSIDPDGITGKSKKLSWIELYRRACRMGIPLQAVGRFDPPTSDVDAVTGDGVPYGSYTFGTQWVKATVNMLTGKIDINNVIAVYDVGRPINPVLLEGQFQGGITTGIGYALSEEVVLREGRMSNSNFDTYLLPTSLDTAEFMLETVDLAEETGPYGAKGIGEPALIPTAAAIANAVYRAIGIRILDLPITPEKVVAALKARERGSEQ